MELVISKNKNPKGDYINSAIAIVIDNKKKELFTITCPPGEEKDVIDAVIKIFGGEYHDNN